jgi:hypothetical protein
MIAADELLMLKARLLVGAEAAGHIASSADPVRYDQEQYEAVHAALLSMKSDITRVLAEIDVLRGMVLNSVSLFLAEERKHGNGLPESGGDVGAVPAPEDHGSGEGEHADPKGTDVGVPVSRPARKRTKRSKPRGNKGGDGVLPVAVGCSDGSQPVDSSKND